MPLCIVVMRDVEMRYRGFLGSVMLEVAPGFYVGPRITKGVRDRIWSVMEDWHGQLQQGSITMAWREAGAPGGLRVQSLGDPPKDLVEHEGSLLVRRPVRNH
jgi:CRISPR-associated protein Cas2